MCIQSSISQNAAKLVSEESLTMPAVYRQDKNLLMYLQIFEKKKPLLIGSDNDLKEFILRFLFSQLLQDWRGPLMAVLVESKEGKLPLKKINRILANWDFTGIFSR